MRILDASSKDWLREALAHLSGGGVIALPTETVYGLATRLDPAAVERLYALKGRAIEKALPLQLDLLERALAWGFDFSAPARRLAEHFWPGPLTLLLPRPGRCPAWFAPDSPLLALRIPDHPVVLDLLRAAGEPLAVTSANRSGKPECLHAGHVARAFEGADDLFVLDGGTAPGGIASTVVDASGPELQLIREGPIARSEISRIWKGER
jgi:L-threonylcarbamoyladenylate synthase